MKPFIPHSKVARNWFNSFSLHSITKANCPFRLCSFHLLFLQLELLNMKSPRLPYLVSSSQDWTFLYLNNLSMFNNVTWDFKKKMYLVRICNGVNIICRTKTYGSKYYYSNPPPNRAWVAAFEEGWVSSNLAGCMGII